MKYWRGYLTAAIFAAFTYALQKFAQAHSVLIDMIYPYVTRIIQDMLSQWSGTVDFCLWQVVAVLLGLALLASIVLMITLRWNPVQWFGWVAAAVSIVFFLHTGIYGLNNYAGPIADDISMEMVEYTVSELADATTYYRDMANQLSTQVPRDGNGDVVSGDFDTVTAAAADGFENLVYVRNYPIFAGSNTPVKELGWDDLYSSMGITGMTMPLTGEAGVNSQIPAVSLPFTICHEMAHRKCIATEKDANFAGFLACQANSDVLYQYSAYFMAYRYCYNSLVSVGTTASAASAQEIAAGNSAELQHDIDGYNAFFSSKKNDTAAKVADTANDTYIKASGDEDGISSYGNVTDLLVSWHYQEIILPNIVEEEHVFDPFDKTQVDISGILGVTEGG